MNRWIWVLLLWNGFGPVELWASELKVDKSKSKVTVDVKATGGDFTALLQDFQAEIHIDDSNYQPTNAVFAWDFKNLKTGKDKRDKAMLDWMETPKFSQASFTFQKWETKNEKTYATGTMNLHGIKKALTFPVALQRKGETMTIRGHASMNHEDFDLKIIRMLLVFKVNPQLEVDFELTGKLVP